MGQESFLCSVEAMASLETMQTIPFDPRFPNQNQTRNCWQNYVDFHRCQKIKGEEYEPCKFFEKNFKTICPAAWIEKWDERETKAPSPPTSRAPSLCVVNF